MEIKNVPGALAIQGQRPIELSASKKPVSDLDYEKVRLRRATREFESFFLASMLKAMRATVPKSSEESEALGGGLGKDLYQDMFDTELSKKMAERSRGGIGDVLYEALVGRVEAEYRAHTQTVSLSETPVRAHTDKTLNHNSHHKDKGSL